MVRFSTSLLADLDLGGSLTIAAATPLDHFPPLISDVCLRGSAKVVADYIRAVFSRESLCQSETIVVPTKTSSNRPVTVMSLPVRVLYAAMVEKIRPGLAPATRGGNSWQEHREFGLERGDAYVVDTDIAACYEYIDHSILTDELALRSLNPQIANAIAALLGEVTGWTRGLPQMLSASDDLADTYLNIIDRHLFRLDYEIHRFADDFRLVVDSWEAANSAMELVSELARRIGLILSSRKTQIFRTSTLKGLQETETEFLDNYLGNAWDELQSDPFRAVSDYDETPDPPEIDDAIALALVRIIDDWREGVRPIAGGGSMALQRTYVSRALKFLADHNDRIAAEVLTELVFQDPQRIEDACQYMSKRAASPHFEADAHWPPFVSLAKMGRQSPWAKVWLLHTMDALPRSTGTAAVEGLSWARRQLSDSHEIVRAEAAWSLAGHGALTSADVQSLYENASDLTQHGLAAAAARGRDLPQRFLSALSGDSPLNKAAMAWSTP